MDKCVLSSVIDNSVSATFLSKTKSIMHEKTMLLLLLLLLYAFNF
jgi:hypothetical protein